LLAKMERGALSMVLLGLFVLFIAQFFVGMAQNLLVTLPMTTFPQNNNAYPEALSYIIVGGDWVLTTHFLIDIGIIALAFATLVLVIHKNNAYRVLSIVGLVSVLFAFVSGLRFAASNFTADLISYQMASGFVLGFIINFVMAMLLYRDIAAKTG
jgi:hypothetical protein